MMKSFIIRYSEIALKGKNRTRFEKRLVENIRKQAKLNNLKPKLIRLQSRIYLETEKEPDLKKIFGISSYSPCIRTGADFEIMCSEALKIAMANKRARTFRVSARRINKDHPLSSIELNKRLGTFIVEKTGLKVDLENHDLDLGVEVIDKEAFIFTKTIPCFGGLPVGVEGKALALVKKRRDSLAPLLLMKRGCAVEFTSKTKPRELEELAKKNKCKAIVVPDTLRNLKEYSVSLPVLRPLVAFSEKEIGEELEKYKSVLE